MSRREFIRSKVMRRVVVCPDRGCWLWQGPTSGSGRGGGYGRMHLDGQTVAVHLVMFTNERGYIPGKKQVDHVCEVRNCCNPAHLELVDQSENQKRRKTRQLTLEARKIENG